MPVSNYEFDALLGIGRVELFLHSDQRVFALFGSNGVGKTKCLEALFQYFLVGCKPFMDQGLLSFNEKLFVAKGYKGGGYSLTVPIPPRGIISGAGTNPGSVHSLPVVFLGAGQRGHLEGETGLSTPIGAFEERRKRYFLSLLRGMESHFSSLGMHASLEQWFVTVAHSANPYQRSADNRKMEINTLLQLLHKVDSRYDPEFMEIDGANHVSLKVDGQVTELRHLSTGFTSLLKVLQAIISGYANFTNEVNLPAVKGIVLIDEIESHLHVEWQTKIVLLLKQLFPNTIFYIATHSPMVLTQLEEGEAYQLKREEDGVVRSHLIIAPNKQALVDVLREGFGVDLNALKRDRMSAESQTDAKQRLLALINGDGAET